MQTSFFQLGRRTSEPVRVDQTLLTYESLVLLLRWPGGGWVWNWPLAVHVDREGKTERIFIVDVTRLAQIALIKATVLFWIWALMARRKRERNKP